MVSASGEAVFATMIVIVGLSTLASAICYLLIGWFRLARLFRFMPYPLVGGFLAGIGWFLVKSSIAVASGTTMTWETLPALAEIDTLQKWAPGVFYGALLLAVAKVRPHYLVLPASAVLAVGICHATLFALDIPLAEATASGILFVGLPAGSAWPPIGLSDLALVDWGVVTSQLPGILAVTLVAVISLVFCAGGLELISGVRIDLNREFRAEGVSSLLAGLGGSAPRLQLDPQLRGQPCDRGRDTADRNHGRGHRRPDPVRRRRPAGAAPDAGARRSRAVRRAQPALRGAGLQPQDAAVAGLRHRPRGLARHRLRRLPGRRGCGSRGGRGLLRRALQQGECRRRSLHPAGAAQQEDPFRHPQRHPPPLGRAGAGLPAERLRHLRQRCRHRRPSQSRAQGRPASAVRAAGLRPGLGLRQLGR